MTKKELSKKLDEYKHLDDNIKVVIDKDIHDYVYKTVEEVYPDMIITDDGGIERKELVLIIK